MCRWVVGSYGTASAYSSAATAGPYSTSYPLGAVSGYTSYGGSAYGSSATASAGAAPYSGGYAGYGSSSY